MLSSCGFSSLIAVLCAEKRRGLEKHIPTYVFRGAKIEDSRNIKRVIIVLCSVITHRVSAQEDVCFLCRHRKEKFCSFQ